MYGIGIDVGSTFTKYCIMSNQLEIVKCFKEKTPVRQTQYFEEKNNQLMELYKEAKIVSCGYGKGNINGIKQINELTALALGANYVEPNIEIILDIGGQDTKVIRQKDGRLLNFFVNDKCAAGSGQFLINTLTQLNMKFKDIEVLGRQKNNNVVLSSACAVFAQSEIVELIAKNTEADDIIEAVLKHIFVQAKKILNKVRIEKILISGGFSQIPDIECYASKILGVECVSLKEGCYLSAIGCALSAMRENKRK